MPNILHKKEAMKQGTLKSIHIKFGCKNVKIFIIFNMVDIVVISEVRDAFLNNAGLYRDIILGWHTFCNFLHDI